MADGLATATVNASQTTNTANADYIQLHVGAPGAAGTANLSSVTTRVAVTWGSPANGTIAASNQPAWNTWGGTNGEVITHISYWSALTAGTFALSMQLNTSATMNTGDSLTLTSLQINIPTAS